VKKSMVMSLLLLLALAQYIVAEAGFPRHVDPSLVSETPNLLDIFTLLHLSTMYLAELNIGKATNITSALRGASVPQQFRDLFNRMLQLYTYFTSEIGMSISYTDSAREALQHNDFAKCSSLIDIAQWHLYNAEVTYFQLRDVLNYFTGAGLAGIIRGILGNMEKVLSIAKSRVVEVLEELNKRKSFSLKDVAIELQVNITKVLYGDFIEVVGSVRDLHGAPLGNRTIAIYYSTSAKWYVKSNATGFFKIAIPVKACGNVTIFAAFIPQGPDVNVYRYVESSVNIVSTCIEPAIRIFIPQPLLVGVNSSMCIESSVQNIKVSVTSKDLGLYRQLELYNHSTCTTFSVPTNISEGVYRISVASEPRKGVPPKALHIYVNVTRLDTNVDIEYPGIILAGVSQTLCITTSQKALLTIVTPVEIKSIEVPRNVKTCIAIGVPISYLNTKMNLEISVNPLNASYRPRVVNVSLQVLNLALLLPSAFLIAFAIIITTPVHSRSSVKARSIAMSVQRRFEALHRVLSPIAKEFTDVVKALSGIEIEAHMTLREYVGKALSKVPSEVREPLLNALKITERILYGLPTHVEDLVKKLKEVLSRIARVLKS